MMSNIELRPLQPGGDHALDEEMVCVGCRGRINPHPDGRSVALFPDSVDDLGRDYGLCTECLADLLNMVNGR